MRFMVVVLGTGDMVALIIGQMCCSMAVRLLTCEYTTLRLVPWRDTPRDPQSISSPKLVRTFLSILTKMSYHLEFCSSDIRVLDAER
jgi:hypothetical protein